ncbi:MAG: hypothetical protein E7773_14375 [Sphingomonas sp.]|uniref:hypothetical protein n=1 Tax=Sphingomonas sp. TaxID=28214 RepID=UPI0012286C85|nr:hypothetical protein [Sphingomonas sp.]THD34839.1 MAG: hypothetical protein E7773_14375 [Sphingomonas sp.]
MPHPSAALLLLLAPAIAASTPVPAAPVDGDGVGQVSITGRIVVRVESAPAPEATLRAMPVPVRWIEKGGPKCIAVSQLSGAIVNDTDSVDLVLKGGTRLRALLDDDCAALGYYGGFYLKTAADGQVCAKRDTIRTRTGESCSIGKFKRLVPRPDKHRKP